ncbi:MAG: fibronectin type III domain-containing protein [Chitinophagaceae bacterium]|nr:fibronectin type III domain-containing protein [Chitinophagaceae bacterium]
MRKIYLFILLILGSLYTVNAQVVDDLFQQRNTLSRDFRQTARKYQALELNLSKFTSLRQQSASSLRLQLPFEGRQLKLQLEKVSITSDDFSVIEARPDGSRQTIRYPGGTFYQGKIEGMSSSFATISIVNDQVSGIIADAQGNIVLSSVENNGTATNEYVLYRESDLLETNPANCFTGETPVDGPVNNTGIQSNGRLNAVGEPVDVYFECDYKFYQDKGSNTVNVINYVLGFFNSTSLLYANENIKIQVSQILVWTTQDPEAAAGLNSTSACLTSFRDRMVSTTYIGDYAHFLSTRSLGGGIAYLLSNPCSSAKQFRSAVSAINNSYSSYPTSTYSWTVEVVTHELGHNLGSNHTQWCGWTGGALDNCYTTEGGCAAGPQPSNGGTIMSYCHLSSTGINFNNGFGQQPGDRIRNIVGNAACFGNCRMTIEVAKQDASCGQNNGSATVTATNGTGTISYGWSNGQTGATLSNAAPGTYHVIVNDGAGCQVMQLVTIGNSGSSLTFSLAPNGTAGFCTGGSLLLTATNNPSYTYVWRKDGVIITGATSSTYNATTAGTYAVTATSGACSGTQSVVVSVVAPPTANITPGGATTFCDGNNVVLNGNAGGSYNYQWYNNGNPVSGATNTTYTATASGSYTVKVSAGTGCEVTSSAVTVTVNASPAATISTTTPASFCSGGNVNLNASSGTGYSYQWYRNSVLLSGATQPVYNTSTGGSYTLVTTLGSCTKTSAATTVTVWANPVVTISPAASTIEKFQSQILNGSGATTYNWDTQPAFIGSAGTNATFKPLTTTNYTIQGTDANGCKGTANATIHVIGCGNVTNITSTKYSPSRVIVRWKNPDGATTDTLQYRKTGSTTWASIYVTGEEYELNGLTPGTDYEYNIIPLCSTTTVFLPSATSTFKTDGLTGGLYVRLFPNPVSTVSKLEIITDKPFALQVSIFDNTGRRVRNVSSTENLPSGQVIKNIEAGILPNGIYHIGININGKMHNVKMIVMH